MGVFSFYKYWELSNKEYFILVIVAKKPHPFNSNEYMHIMSWIFGWLEFIASQNSNRNWDILQANPLHDILLYDTPTYLHPLIYVQCVKCYVGQKAHSSFPTTSYENNPNELFGHLFLFIRKCLAHGKCSMNTFWIN